MVVRRSALVTGSAAEGMVRIPVPAFLIEHPDGLVLFDAGLAPEAVADPCGCYGSRAERLQLHFTPAQLVDAQVRAAGHLPADVTHVVVSHLHFDHAGGVRLFPCAQVLLGAGELAHAGSGSDGYCRAEDVRSVAQCELGVIDRETDLFGDGSVVVVPTPGHTPGHLSLLVRAADRAYVLAGDALHTRAALAPELPFPNDLDPVEAVSSIRRLKDVARRADAEIWVSHDPDDWARWAGTELASP